MTNVLTYDLPYKGDSSWLMSLLSELEMPVFLNSGGPRSAASRYDILAAEPVAYLLIENGSSQCSEPGLEVDGFDLFSTIKILQSTFLPKSEKDHETVQRFPFQGGLLGFLGYPILVGKDCLRILDAFVGVYRWAVISDHSEHLTTLIFHPSSTTESRTRIIAMLNETRANRPAPNPLEFMLTAEFSNQISREQYNLAFDRIKQYIQAGDCYQVNLAQQFRATCSGHPISRLFQTTRSKSCPFLGLYQLAKRCFAKCITGTIP